jgi:adenine deaminase
VEILNSNDVEELLASPAIKYLSEMMNYPGVVYGNTEVLQKLESARKERKACRWSRTGTDRGNVKKYVGAGISTDHECSTIDEAREKLR